VVAGAGNVGKSLLVAGDFAARVSAGSAWPDGSACTPGDVLIASGHDSAADTLVPRLGDYGPEKGRHADTPFHRVLLFNRRHRRAGGREEGLFGHVQDGGCLPGLLARHRGGATPARD